MSSFNPLVSVILPCYNAENFVEASVRSIMDQTYSNLEIILIDDSSSDKTLYILQSLGKLDPRIKIFHNEKNEGLVASLNKGIANAKGKYIARMDADDIALANRIEKQVNFMEVNNDVAVCGSNYLVIDDKNKQVGKIEFPLENAVIKTELLFTNAFGHPTTIIKKEALEKCGYYEEGMVPAEDYELWIRISKHYEVANIYDKLLKYRVHENNLTITKKENQIHVFRKIMNKHGDVFGNAETFINYHLKFLSGTWNKKSSIEEINGFKQWKKALIKKNLNTGLTETRVIKKCFNKYYSNALLSIIKSNENGYQVKLHALKKLLFINPLITIKHFIKKF
jgi:glycosyltransferase involved in cell wall biosynthesis